MKNMIAALLALMMLLAGGGALAELGFAEVRKENVNIRESAGGARRWQVDAPQSVYVYEEKTVSGQLWCHVSTYIGKNPQTGWIRGDMLRFLSEEFYDVVDVIAGRSYVMGLRSDGTVAIMGDDMPHAPCIDQVRTWKNIRAIGTRVCSAYGLTEEGVLHGVGLQKNFNGIRADQIGVGYPYPLDAQGHFLYEEWARAWDEDVDNWSVFALDDFMGNAELVSAIGEGTNPRFVLAKDGCVYEFSYPVGGDTVLQYSNDVPYIGVSGLNEHTLALRQDGLVDTIRCIGLDEGKRCAVCDGVAAWTDVVQVEAAGTYALGLRSDGTVLYAGGDRTMARQVAAWSGVKDIAAQAECSIALFDDGHVEMAGHYHEYYFR